MAEMKTKVNDASVEAFLDGIANQTRREVAKTVSALMKSVTRKPPKMWGDSIVGFDQYHYKYATGRQGDMPMLAFSPRAQALTIYLMPAIPKYKSLVKVLGKAKISGSCLHIRKIQDVDVKVLRQLVSEGFKYMKATYGASRRT